MVTNPVDNVVAVDWSHGERMPKRSRQRPRGNASFASRPGGEGKTTTRGESVRRPLSRTAASAPKELEETSSPANRAISRGPNKPASGARCRSGTCGKIRPKMTSSGPHPPRRAGGRTAGTGERVESRPRSPWAAVARSSAKSPVPQPRPRDHRRPWGVPRVQGIAGRQPRRRERRGPSAATERSAGAVRWRVGASCSAVRSADRRARDDHAETEEDEHHGALARTRVGAVLAAGWE